MTLIESDLNIPSRVTDGLQKAGAKMSRVKFTAGRIEAFRCEAGKSQSFLWDAGAPGLGLRAVPGGAKSYIFQGKLNGQTIRVTIGDPRAWDISSAQAEARRLKVLIDSGRDPRAVEADRIAAEAAAKSSAIGEAMRQTVTLGHVWPVYMADRTPNWQEHHIDAHRKLMQLGGQPRKRSPKLTVAGPLAALADIRLVDLTSERIEAWAKQEVAFRPSSARLALRLLKACLNWCAENAAYSSIVTTNAAKSNRARETLGKPKKRTGVLHRQQLASWFAAVRRIGNPVISAYLQCLLLLGPRREELAELRWTDVDFQWGSLKLSDKIEGFRMIPLPPYVAHLMNALPRRNEWVFSSPEAESGHLVEPRIAHNSALAVAGLPPLTLHDLRRSFATLCEWIEVPAGISAQIQGHAPQGVREQNYIHRPLDLLQMWHFKIETWMLEQADISFTPAPARLHAVGAA